MTMLEFEFIKKCTASLPSQAEGLLCGIGDDCAVFTGSASRDWLITTDAFSEGIHFNRDWMSAAEIGRRCLTGAVSDIAAMGGRPRYVTVAIAVPSTLPAELAAAVMAGISTEAGAHQMVVIGGDTSAAAHDLHLVLTVIGDIRHGAALYRRFAKVGDAVYVTGNLGGSLAGLRELQRVPLLCKEGPGEVETLPHPTSPCKGEEEIMKNYITPTGLEKLKTELRKLRDEERPKLLETIAWAAGNGDRSENADYIYGKKRLREIEKRLRFLTKRLEIAEVVDPATISTEKVSFGARVTIRDESGATVDYQIVGEDEIDTAAGQISWQSPIAKALLGKKQGDAVSVHRPAGTIEVEIVAITSLK